MKRHMFAQEFSAASPYCGALVLLSDGTGDTCGLLKDDPVHITETEGKYLAVLHQWAAQHIPAGAHVTSVSIDYDDGYDPTFTDRPASLSVAINFDGPSYGTTSPDVATVCTSIGELLTALFRIEETP